MTFNWLTLGYAALAVSVSSAAVAANLAKDDRSVEVIHAAADAATNSSEAVVDQEIAPADKTPNGLASVDIHNISVEALLEVAKPKVSDIDADLICMAKAVHHEAANQPLSGQLALAQVIMNRSALPKFSSTICGVVNQPGQFFNTRGYSPRQDRRWQVALAISRLARAEAVPNVVPGAVFFQAVSVKHGWMATRPRVAQIGGHVFYR